MSTRTSTHIPSRPRTPAAHATAHAAAHTTAVSAGQVR